jgi:hypothetical protein
LSHTSLEPTILRGQVSDLMNGGLRQFAENVAVAYRVYQPLLSDGKVIQELVNQQIATLEEIHRTVSRDSVISRRRRTAASATAAGGKSTRWRFIAHFTRHHRSWYLGGPLRI